MPMMPAPGKQGQRFDDSKAHKPSDGNWIEKATANSRGQFAAKAKGAGMSTAGFAAKKEGAPGKTGKQARLAKTLMGLGRKG